MLLAMRQGGALLQLRTRRPFSHHTQRRKTTAVNQHCTQVAYLENHGGVGEAQHDVTVVIIRQSLHGRKTEREKVNIINMGDKK